MQQYNYSNKIQYATLMVDGGHFDKAMKDVIYNRARKFGINAKTLHLSVNMFLEMIENRLNIKFDPEQKFFYQGTDTGMPNEFHKKLKDQYNFRVRVHDMKKQNGNKVRDVVVKTPAVSLPVIIPPTTVPPPPMPLELTVVLPVNRSYFHRFCTMFASLFYSSNNEVVIANDAVTIDAIVVTTNDNVATDPVLKVDHVAPLNEKARIWIERGVDVHLAVEAMECAYGLNGYFQNNVIVFITGDSDFEDLLVTTSKSTEVIVISQGGALSPRIARFTPREPIDLEWMMDQCINANYVGNAVGNAVGNNVDKLVVPRNNYVHANAPPPPPPSYVRPPPPEPNPVVKQVKNNFAPKPYTPSAGQIEQETDKSGDIALALHYFIATKWNHGKPFFLMDFGKFYEEDDNEVFKKCVKKMGAQRICDIWPELLTTKILCHKGSRVSLSDSERSQQLVNGYFITNDVSDTSVSVKNVTVDYFGCIHQEEQE